eukprot:NODE_341_length_10628_cov_0.466996.p6 type:complete len:161 gc:universal NODE_341_length_10628_cov_0.466996:2386-2868(+)
MYIFIPSIPILKCVANIVIQFIFCRCLHTAYASAYPSIELVPLPNSSIIIKLLLVALFNILLVSISSTMNVLCPIAISSLAPTLVYIWSTMIPLYSLLLVFIPICAIITVIATCLNKVLLPPIFGPVSINMLFLIITSFGMKSFNTGCVHSFISNETSCD